jgi:hypothetical protein
MCSLLPLENRHAIVQRQNERVKAGVVLAELVEPAHGLAALDPVGDKILPEMRASVGVNGKTARKDYASISSVMLCAFQLLNLQFPFDRSQLLHLDSESTLPT